MMGNKLFQGFDEAVRGLAVGQKTELEVSVQIVFRTCVSTLQLPGNFALQHCYIPFIVHTVREADSTEFCYP